MNKNGKYVIRFLRDFSKKNKSLYFFSAVCAVIGAVRPYINIVLMGMLLDAVRAGGEYFVLLKYALLALGANMLLRICEARSREWFNQKNEYMRELEARTLNRKSLSMDYEYLEDSSVLELRRKSQAEGVYIGLAGWLIFRLEQVFTNALSILFAFIIMIRLLLTTESKGGFPGSWVSSLILFLLVAIFVWINYCYSGTCAKRGKDLDDMLAGTHNRYDYYIDKLAGIESQKDLRIYAQQEVIEEDSEKAVQELICGEKKIADIFVRREWLGQGLSDLSGLLVYLFTGLRAYAGMITIGSVVTYAASILQFSKSVALLAAKAADIKQIALYCRDYAEYMDLKKQKYEGTLPVEKRRDNRFTVEFCHVSFRYPGTGQDILKDLNIKFEIGEKMAIVGRNGSGKTTFIKLLCRLYDVTEGCIKVNGIDIRKYDYQEYCALFAVVFQDFRIFSFPVGENIAASDEVEEDRAVKALQRAGIGERIENLPGGLNTYAGKDFAKEGVTFSGGEKQKMAIARAIYKDAPFVIMDEPTAALDPVSECEVFAGFDKMVGNKTAIYISHRLASCRFCQDILVFDHGTVVQRGSHEELEKADGLYKELWNAQAQYYA